MHFQNIIVSAEQPTNYHAQLPLGTISLQIQAVRLQEQSNPLIQKLS